MEKLLGILLFTLCHSFIRAQILETERFAEFQICPKSHRYAFQNGARCCHGFNKTEGDCSGIELKRYSTCCLDESVSCPKGKDCEDFKSPCLGWDLVHAPKPYHEVVGAYNFSTEYDGRYFFNLTDLDTSIFWNNRGVYVKEKSDKCIWWNKRPQRRWWLGKCADIGRPQGFAYLDTDESCPYIDGTDWRNPPLFWKSGLNNNLLKGYTVSWGVAGADIPGFVPAASAVSHTLKNGLYKPRCFWKFVRGRFRCITRGGTKIQETTTF